MIVAVLTKTEDESARFSVDFTAHLAGQTIGSEDVTAEAPLTLENVARSGAVLSGTVNGGDAGTTKRVFITLSLSEGGAVEAEIFVRIEDLEVGVNTYAGLEDADEYFAGRNETAWLALTRGSREAALLRGTEYIEDRYRGRWPGRITDRDQALAWPRRLAYDADGFLIGTDVVPSQVVRATYLAALLESASPGILQPTLGTTQVEEEVTVGPISVRYASDASAAGKTRPIVTAIDDVLASLLHISPMGGFLVRA